MASLSELFGGTPSNVQQLPTRSTSQMNIMDQLAQLGIGGLQQNKFDFAPIEAQAREGFQQKTIPTIMERLTSMGGGGGRSNALAQTLGQAGAGLETNLASLKSQYGLQQQNQLMNMLNLGLQPNFENIYNPSSPGLGTAAASGVGQGFGMLLPILLQAGLGGATGGPVGAGVGALTAILQKLLANKGVTDGTNS